MSVNKVILLGNVGQDPDIRYPEKDKIIAFVSLSTNDYYPATGEVTEWHRLVMGGENARLKIRRRVTEVIVERVEILGRSTNQQ